MQIRLTQLAAGLVDESKGENETIETLVAKKKRRFLSISFPRESAHWHERTLQTCWPVRDPAS
jgi:hypothetical protein